MPAINGDGSRILTDDVIVKEGLRLLKNNLVVVPLVYRDLEKRFAKVGETISLKKPFRVKSASGRILVKQPLVDQTIPFTINNQEHVGLEITQRDRTLSLTQFSDRYLKSGIVQIANKVDRSVLLEMKNAFMISGTPGTAITVKDLMYADAHMTNVAVPSDGMRRAIFNTMSSAEISDEISTKYNQNMVKGAIQKGYMGPLSDFDCFKSANIPTHTVGAHGGTPLANAVTAQTGSSIVTDGWDTGVTGLLLQGDVLTFAGVFEINPQSYESTGRLQGFVVQADVDSDGSGNATISVSPSINDGTLSTIDGEGNSISLKAYQNVSAPVANNAAIVVNGVAGVTYREQFLFHRDAVALAMIDLELPQSAVIKSRVRDADSGLSLCMTGQFDINNQSEITRIDAVWGAHMIYPELAHRLRNENI